MPEQMGKRESSGSVSARRRNMSDSSDHSRSPERKRRHKTPEEKHKHSRRRYSRNRGHRSRSRSSSKSRSPHRSRDRHSHSRTRSRHSYSSSERRHYDRKKSRSPLSQRRRHVGTRERPLQSRCLGVFGLSIHTTEEKLTKLFLKFGPIERVQVVIDAKTGRSRGFCFIYFESSEDAKVAKEQCSGIEIDGRRIRVDYSITQRAHTPTPGVYMGRPTQTYKDKEYHDRYRDDDSHRDKYRRHSPTLYSRDHRKRRERTRSVSYSPRDRRYR